MVGAHNLTVYAWNDAGNISASQTVMFDVVEMPSASLQSSEPFPTRLVVAFSGALLTVTAAGLLIYLGTAVEVNQQKMIQKSL